MAKTVIGLDIGSNAVRAVELTAHGRGPATLDRVGEVPLPPGTVRDGEVVDVDALAQSLRTLWSSFGFKGRKVAVGVANQQVVVRQVDLPYLPEDELRRSLHLQVQDLIPIALDQAILDFHVTEVYEADDGTRFNQLLLVAAQRTMVGPILAALEKAKLKPVSLDLDAFAILRSLAPQSLLDGEAGELLVDVGHGVTDIVVHENGVPRFVRILPMGGGSITDGLADALGLGRDDAEARKVAVGWSDAPDDVSAVIVERADLLVDEIRGSLDFYAAQAGSVAVGRVVLSGGGGQLNGLAARLEETLRIPVERGHPMQELKIGKVDLDTDQLVDAEPHLAVAIGLAQGELV